MARDWRWRPAKFRGVTFYVDGASPQGGRRKAVHEYPGSDYWDVEDLGSKAKRISVTAYFVSETADVDYAAFVAVCDQPTPATLNLPFFDVVQASVETWDPTWTKERLNYVGGNFTFIVENPAGAPVPLGLGERIIAGMLAGASATIGGAITGLFAGIPATSYQRSDATGRLLELAAFVATLRQSTALPDATAATTGAALDALTPTAIQASESDPGVFVASALDVLDAIVIDALPDDAAPTFKTAAALAATMVQPTLIGQLDVGQAADTITAGLAVASAMQAIRLIATSTYVDRPTASAARDAIGVLARQVLPFVGSLGADVSSAFSDLWGQVSRYLTQLIINLAPVLLYETNISLPSTVLAYRLYGDPSRASELVARNQISMPFLMPTRFEAASS